ncbi:FAD-dependent monooxygenase [Nonomuraea sp. NPDC046570]|uniref:FAD-dependent monooxygenase n=1 Tax=Nonomuraea sp. NPDC046570 TaxID=3155255 RepID=UPI0033D2292A
MEVIVAGGGVAGAAGAVALRRIGARVTVYEAHDDPAGQVGSFLSLASNGLRALDALGCLGQVQEAGFAVPRQKIWSSSGRLLGDVPRGRLSGDDLHSVTLMRGRLVETLRERALAAGARIVTGQRLTGAVTGPAHVNATFSGGGTARADLLVGADGIWSATRTLLDPAAPTPAYAGMYQLSGVSEGLDLEPGSFNMVFARGGAFLYLPAPDGTVWWSAQVAAPQPPDLAEIGLERVAEVYRSERVPSAVLAAATQVHRPTLDHVLGQVPRWHDERIALVGDAAHPVGAGQGASMAIEDAVVLARCLEAGESIPAALADYDRVRRARVARMVKVAGGNRDTKTAGPLGRTLNNLVMSIFFRHFHEKATAWLYADSAAA